MKRELTFRWPLAGNAWLQQWDTYEQDPETRRWRLVRTEYV